jgi:hypothetical protein
VRTTKRKAAARKASATRRSKRPTRRRH